MTSQGTFVWNEPASERPAGDGSSYSEVFGWDRTETDAGPFGTYTTFSIEGTDVAGMMTPTGSDYKDAPPPRWNGYVAVDDIDAVVAAAERAGGTIHEPPTAGMKGRGEPSLFSARTRLYAMRASALRNAFG